MAQRELKVKVSADIDSSLTKLLKVLDSKSNYKINVKLNVDDGGLGKLLKSLDLLSSKANKSSTVRVNGDGSGLNRVQSALENVERQANKVNNTEVSPRSSGAGMGALEDSLGDADEQIDQINNQVVEPRSSGRGLDDLLQSLDNVSSKILQITADVGKMALGDALQSSTDLFDAQKSFANQMGSIGRSDNWINKQLADLNEYGAKSKYSIAEMVDAFSQFEGAGNKASMALVKGAAGLASYAKKPSQALRGINRQLFQMDKNSLVFNRDWNAIRDNIGGAATTALKDWLRLHKGIEVTQDSLAGGALSATDLQEAIVAVGNTNRFQSMAKQVNTVGSAMENLQETITANLVGTLDNEGPLSKFYNGVVSFLNDLTDEVPSIMQKLANGLDSVMSLLEDSFGEFTAKNLVNGISDMVSQLGVFIGPFVKLVSVLTGKGKYIGTYLGAIVTSAMAFKLLNYPARVLNMFAGGVGVLARAMNLLKRSGGGGGAGKSMFSKPLSIAQQGMNLVNNVGTILSVAAAAKILASAYKDIASIDVSYTQAMTNLAGLVTTTTVIGGYATLLGKAMQKFSSLKSNLLAGSAAMTGIGLAMAVMAKSVQVVSRANLNAGNIASNLAIMLTAITATGAFAAGAGAALTGITGAIPALTAGAVALTAINLFLLANTAIFASVVKNINKIAGTLNDMPEVENIGHKVSNIAKLMLAMAGIGTVGFATGAISLFGNALQALANLSITANLSTLKTTIAALNSIPDIDSSGLQAKIKSVTGLISAIQSGFSVTGAEGFQAVLTGFGNALQALSNTAITANIRSAATTLNQLNAVQVPDNTSEITQKINNLKKIMQSLSSASGGSMPWDVLAASYRAMSTALNSLSSALQIGTFKKIINFSNQLAKYEMQPVATVKSKISNLKKIMKAIGGGDEGDALADVAATLKHAVGSVKNSLAGFDVGALTKTFGKVLNFANSLSKYKPVSSAAIRAKLNSIKDVMKQLNGFSLGDVQHVEKSQAKDISRVVKIVTQIKKLTDTLNSVANVDIASKINVIKNAIKAISQITIPTVDKNVTGNASKFAQLVASIQKMAGAVAEIAKLKDVSAAPGVLSQLKGAIKNITSIATSIGEQKLGKGSVKSASSFESIVKSIASIASMLNSLPTIPDDIGQRIQKIKDAMKQINEAFNGGAAGAMGVVSGGDAGAMASKGNLAAIKGLLAQVKAVQQVANIVNSLPTLPDDIGARIQKIKSVMNEIALAFNGGSVGAMGVLSGATGGTSSKGSTAAVGDIISQVKAIQTIANVLATLPTLPDDIAQRVSKIKNAMNAVQQAFSNTGSSVGAGVGAMGALSGASGGTVDVSGAVSQVQSIVKIAGLLATMPAIAEDTVQKIRNVKTALQEIGSIQIPEGFAMGIEAAITSLNMFVSQVVSLAPRLTNIGQTLGNSIADGFRSANPGERMYVIVSEAITRLDGLAGRAYGVGARISGQLVSGFDVSGIIGEIRSIQAAIDSLQGKTVYIDVVERKTKVDKAHGGLIDPEYRATGGVVGSRWFKPSGTDTIPAMLTPGEFVLKRSVVGAIGDSLLNALNNMNINKFMLGMGNKFGVNRTTNNVTNNITQNVDNKTNLVRGMGELRGIVRP